MQIEPTLAPAQPAAALRALAPLSEAAREAWKVDFIVPVPPSMPSERMQARAELVRSALSSNQY